MSGNRKDMDSLLRRARRAGLSVVTGGSGHWRVTCPTTGRSVTCSKTPRTDWGVKAAKKDIESLLREMADA